MMMLRILCALLATLNVVQSQLETDYDSLQATFDHRIMTSGGKSFSLFDDHFFGLVTFLYTEPMRCFGSDSETPFDIAVLGAPFDTGTTYRPGARFGPNGIRQGSRHHHIATMDPFMGIRIPDYLDVVDCGDVPMVRTDNKVALRQLETSGRDIIKRTASHIYAGESLAKDEKFHPRILTLGGDHTITLPLLRSVAEVYGPITVIHFDSHLDTWWPEKLDTVPRLPGETRSVNHGTYFWFAHKEGLLANNTNIHVGIRGAIDPVDLETDVERGFSISYADEIEDIGYKGVVKAIRDRVGDNPVYITLDIDVIDPGMAPATGTPEIGGYTTREMKKILKGLAGLKIVGADIVEVAPAYDTQSELTQFTAADIGKLVLSLMAKTPLTKS